MNSRIDFDELPVLLARNVKPLRVKTIDELHDDCLQVEEALSAFAHERQEDQGARPNQSGLRVVACLVEGFTKSLFYFLGRGQFPIRLLEATHFVLGRGAEDVKVAHSSVSHSSVVGTSEGSGAGAPSRGFREAARGGDVS